jgi:multiple sugar transport system permease protein
MMSIIIMDIWKNSGFFMIIFIAAFRACWKSIMDAAIMDEASLLAPVFAHRLPWISPVVFFDRLCLDRRVAGLRVDRHSDPGVASGDATRSMSIHIVEEAFGSFEIDTALPSLSS